MSKASFIPDLIPYNEMHRILREKFNVTHDELRFCLLFVFFLLGLSLLIPFSF